MKKLIFLAFSLATLTSKAQSFIFSDDFTTFKGLTNNNLTGYTNWDETCCAWSFTISDTAYRSSSKSGRWELRKSDPSPQPNDSKRTQMEWNGFALATGATWYALSILHPSWMGFDAAPEDLFDLHDKMPNNGSSNWTNPFGIWEENGRWNCHITYDSLDISIDQGAHIVNKKIDLGAVVPGQWVDWVLNTNYAFTDTGFVKIWKNGVLVVNYTGKCAYRGALPDPYFKFGIYKWPWDIPSFQPPSTTTLRVFYCDNLRIGGRTNTISDFLIGAPPNLLPHANAGGNKSIQLPQHEVSLSGTGSTDADGTISTFAWTRISGPNTPAITGASTSIATVGHHVSGADTLIVGTYVYKLVVTDNSGGKDSQNVQIIVNAAANLSPVAKAGTDFSVQLPAGVSLSGTGSQDFDGTISTYLWSQNSGPNTAVFAHADSAQTGVSGFVQGVYVFKLTVTDNSGATGLDTIIVTILNNPNVDPVAVPPSHTSHLDRVSLSSGVGVLDGTNSYDEDGRIVKYQWESVIGPSSPTFSKSDSSITTISNLVRGTYTLRLTVTDDQGASTAIDFFFYVTPILPRKGLISN